MTLAFLFWLVLCVCRVRSVPIASNDLKLVIEVLQRVNILPRGPVTEAEFGVFVALNVTPVPECPMANHVFACNASGAIVSLNLTQTTPAPARTFSVIEHLASVDRVEIRNFVGNVRLRIIADELRIYDSVLVGNMPGAVGEYFRFDAPMLVMRNVSLPYYSPINDVLFRNFTLCSFTNVTFRCPIPDFLLPCFPPGQPVPCHSNPSADIVTAFGYVDSTCIRTGSACMVTCPPLKAGPEFGCIGEGKSIASSFFPATPGFATLEIVDSMFGEAENLFWQSFSTRGMLTRVELFDWRTMNWTVVVDRYMPTRYDQRDFSVESVALPPLLTNRARVTFEMYFFPSDSLVDIKLAIADYPDRAAPAEPSVVCASPMSLNARSMLDETIAESFCIGRVCQIACTNSPSYRFDRVVVPQFIAIEGGAVWRGGTLVATTSEATRVYALDSSGATATNFVNVTGVGEATRVMLIGSPVDGQALPGAPLPLRKGLPGVFAKFRWAVVPSGGTIVADASGAFAGRSAAAPFPLDTTTSIAVVRNTTYALASGKLYRFQDSTWMSVDAELTRYRLNLADAQLELPRKLAAVNDRLLVVIAGLAYIHDGSNDRNRAFRWWNQTAIDVLDVDAGVWFPSLLQHDAQANISDVDVVQWNATTFGIVWPGAASSIVQFRPFPYALVNCTGNGDCATCLTNEANIESCRWCGARCGALCTPSEVATLNVSLCPAATTTATAATTANTTAPPLTTDSTTSKLPTTSTVMSLSSSEPSTASAGLSQSATIGLAVGVPLAILTIVGLAVGAIWWTRRRPKDGGDGGDVVVKGDVPLANRPEAAAKPRAYDAFEANAYDDIVSVRPDQAAYARAPVLDVDDTSDAVSDDTSDADDTSSDHAST